MSGSHVALIVEDEPLILEFLVNLAESMGHETRTASTLEEARREIDRGGFCYVLLDLQFPANGKSRENVACGITALGLLREKYWRTTARGKHVMPVIVVTSYSCEPAFVSKIMAEKDADDFIAKPFGQHYDPIVDKINAALARGERADHGACEADMGVSALASVAPVPASPVPVALVSAPAATAAPRSEVVLAVDGTRGVRKTTVTVSGHPVEMQDALFAVLLMLMAAHVAAPGAWSDAMKLGLTRKAHLPHRIRKALEDLLPEGFEVIQANRAGGYRLNERVTVGAVAWEALLEHPELDVQKAAKERLGKHR